MDNKTRINCYCIKHAGKRELQGGYSRNKIILKTYGTFMDTSRENGARERNRTANKQEGAKIALKKKYLILSS